MDQKRIQEIMDNGGFTRLAREIIAGDQPLAPLLKEMSAVVDFLMDESRTDDDQANSNQSKIG